jgi:alkaline phosphatase
VIGALPLVLVSALAWSCAPAAQPPATAPPRVILFIADGAGVAHWTAGYLAADSLGRPLAVSTFPVMGLLDPRNTSRLLPESASAATAFATGVRSYYNAVGVGPDSLPRPSVLEAAEEAGLATGVITTTLLVDATAAAFLAHVRHRHERNEIADQIADKDVEVLMGDGKGWFDGTLRADSANLLEAMDLRYVVVDGGAELRALETDSIDALLGFFVMDASRNPATRDPSLAEMTRAALEVLDRDPDGFFLLVENEHTDHSAHENLPAASLAGEILAFDAAIREALAYRERHPETLIVVASDHETGGVSLVPASTGPLETRYGSTDHTLTLVPLFVIGPGAERFAGIRRNEDLGRLLMEAVSSGPGSTTAPPAGPD